MSAHIHMRLLAQALFAACIAGCSRQAGLELVVISPHPPETRREFSLAFSDWYQARTGTAVTIKWLDVGGTGEAIEYVRSRNKGGAGGVDVFFGGGDVPFVRLKKEGLLAKHGVPDSILRRIPRTANGVEVFQSDSSWYGAALSSFGILYNREILRRNNLPEPKTWEDLARPECFGWVSAGDPRYSGTMHMMFEILLQSYGWSKGWDVIARLSANVQSYAKSASIASKEVSLAQAAYGLAIDYYAFLEIERYGTEKLGFVMPEGQTLVGVDGIAQLANGPRPDLAGAFVDFVLSEGQKLWLLRTGEPGGPRQSALCRPPVDSTLYSLDKQKWSIADNPYHLKAALRYDSGKGGKRWALFGDLFSAVIIAPHELLKASWKRAIEQKLPAEKYEARFGVTLTEDDVMALSKGWGDRDFAQKRIQTMNGWTRQARTRYRGE